MFELRDRSRPPTLATRSILTAVGLLPLLCSARAVARDDTTAIVDKAHWLEGRGQLEQAKELLSRAAEQAPLDETIALARAEAYLLDKNPFWALKVLGELVKRDPMACSARALAARAHIQQANLEQAVQLLDAPGCERREEVRARFALLRLELAELQGERSNVNEQFKLGRAALTRYEEDDHRLSRLARRYDPWHEPTFAFKLELGAGWSSSGLGSVPLDLAQLRSQASSSLLGIDLDARVVPVRLPEWRPVFEVEAHVAQYLESETKALSTRQPLWRLGVEFGRGPRRLLLAYAGDFISLDGGSDYPNDSFLYASGHRLEYRIGLDRTFSVYGAFGRRQFWQSVRTRLEGEQGLVKSLSVSDTIGLTLGGSSHVYKAEHAAYDQFGAGINAALTFALPKGFELRESLRLGLDYFPRSGGYFEPATRDRRHDNQLRIGVGLSAPYVMGLRLGLSYGYVNRASNVDAFDFTDHRGIVTVTWQSDSDRLQVRSIPKAGRVPLPYPDDETQTGTGKQLEIVEAIRKDESQRQSTSCMK